MLRLTRTCMPNLVLFLFLISIIVDVSTSARNLSGQKASIPSSGSDQTITFLMNDVLGSGHSSSRSPPADNGAQLQPPKPASIILHKNQVASAGGWLSILTASQALQAGIVTMIDEELIMSNVKLGPLPPLLGKVQGIYVTSTEDSSSHIVAMSVTFANGEPGDSLRLFGVYQPALLESQVAVVGGTGRFHDTNGLAILKAVVETAPSSDKGSMHHKVLAVNVHLK